MVNHLANVFVLSASGFVEAGNPKPTSRENVTAAVPTLNFPIRASYGRTVMVFGRLVETAVYPFVKVRGPPPRKSFIRAYAKALARLLGVGAFLLCDTEVCIAASPTISGTVTSTDQYPFIGEVVFNRCASKDYEICTGGKVATAQVDEGGNFSLAVASELGTVQAVAISSSIENSYRPPARSKPFVVKKNDVVVNILADPFPLTITDLKWSGKSVPKDGVSILTGTLRNHSSGDLSVDLWFVVNAWPTGSEAEFSSFVLGPSGSATPLKIAVPLDGTAEFSLPFIVPPGALIGSGGNVILYAGKSGRPTDTYMIGGQYYYKVVPAEVSAEAAR